MQTTGLHAILGLLVFLFCSGVGGALYAEDPISLGAGIASQSPDTFLVEVNGCIVPTGANKIIGWTYDWGDRHVTSSYFSTFHRYTRPGTFTIRVGGYDDQNDSRVVTFLLTRQPKEGAGIVSVNRPPPLSFFVTRRKAPVLMPLTEDFLWHPRQASFDLICAQIG